MMMNQTLQASPMTMPLANQVALLSGSVKRGLSHDALATVIAYIEDHLGESIRLQDLAGTVGISRFHFARLFRVSTGLSPMEFLVRKRIERAKSYLAQTDRGLCEIAASLGFCDQSHFSRSFRRYAGMTPGQFVRRCLETCSSATPLEGAPA